MSPLLFVILLGLLAGLVLFLIVTGAGALISMLLAKRQGKRGRTSAQVTPDEFSDVLVGEPTVTTEAEAVAHELAAQDSFIAAHEAEFAQSTSEAQGGEGRALMVLEAAPEQAAVSAEPATPPTKQRRGLKFPGRKQNTAPGSTPHAGELEEDAPPVIEPAASTAPQDKLELSAAAPVESDRDDTSSVSVDSQSQPSLEAEPERAPVTSAPEVAADPEPVAPAPTRRGGLFPKRAEVAEPKVEPEAAPEESAPAPAPVEEAEPASQPADPFAAVLAAVNKH